MSWIDRTSQACWVSFSWETFDQNKYHLHAEGKGWYRGEALISRATAYAISSLPCCFHSGTLAFLWNTQTVKTPPAFFFPHVAISFQRWYLNYAKGQPWQTEQLISAFQSRVRINIQQWNLHLCKRTNDKMMPARTIQILINLNMWVSGKWENIICSDKLTKRLAANKMDSELGIILFLIIYFSLNSLCTTSLPFHPVFKSHFKLITEKFLNIWNIMVQIIMM